MNILNIYCIINNKLYRFTGQYFQLIDYLKNSNNRNKYKNFILGCCYYVFYLIIRKLKIGKKQLMNLIL